MKKILAMLMAFVLILCTLIPAAAEIPDDLLLNTDPGDMFIIDPSFEIGIPMDGMMYGGYEIEIAYVPTQEEIEATNGLWSLRGEDGRQIAVAVLFVDGLAAFGSGSGEPVLGLCNITQDGKLHIEDVQGQELMCFSGVGRDQLIGEGAAQGHTLVREIETRYALLPEMVGEWVGEGPNRSQLTVKEDGTLKAHIDGRWFPVSGYWFGLCDNMAVFVYDGLEPMVNMLDGPDRLTDPWEGLYEEKSRAEAAAMGIDYEVYQMMVGHVEVYGLIRKGK